MRTVHAQLLDGNRITVDASECATVAQLKVLISGALPGDQKGLGVRLVAGGRLLRQDTESLDSCHIIDGAVVHTMIDRRRPAAPAASPPSIPDSGASGSSTESPRGLNRLVAAGAPREQVETLRAVYSSQIQMVADRLPRMGDSRLHWSRAEDAWLLAQPCPHNQRPSEAVINLQPILRELGDRLPCRIGSPQVGGEGEAGTPRSWIDPAGALGLRGGTDGDGADSGGGAVVGVGDGEDDEPLIDGAAIAPNRNDDDDDDDDRMDEAEENAARGQRRPRTWLGAGCGLFGGFAVGYFGGVWALLFMRGGQQAGPWFMIGCMLGVMVSIAVPIPYSSSRTGEGQNVDPAVSLRLPPSLRGGDSGSGDSLPSTKQPIPVVEFGDTADPDTVPARRALAARSPIDTGFLPYGLFGQIGQVALRMAYVEQ